MKNILHSYCSGIKALLLYIVFLSAITCANATSAANYYPIANATDLSVLSNWTSDATGVNTTLNPANFTAVGQVFYITNNNGSNGNANLTIGANWTVSGSGSSVVVGDGTSAVNFIIPAAYKLTGSISLIKANAVVTVSNITGITWPASADPASTIDFLDLGVTSTIPVAMVYGSVIFDGTKFTNTGTNTFTVAGDFTLQNTGAGFFPGNTGLTKTTINLTGANNQTLTGNGLVFDCYNFSDTAKTTGTVTFAVNTPITFNNSLWLKQSGYANLFSDGGNTFTSLNNINMFGSESGFNLTGTLVLAGASGTQKINDNNNHAVPGPAVAVFNNITINTSGTGKVSFITNTANAVTTIKGNFINNSTTSSGPSVTLNSISPLSGVDTFNIKGNFINNQNMPFSYNTGTVYSFCGSVAQTLQTAATADIITNLNISNTAGVTMASPFSLSGVLNLTAGLLNTTITNILTLTATASSSVGTSTSYVNGPLVKTGNTAFIFQIGENGRYAPIGISAPATVTNAITAFYTFTACSSGMLALNSPLENVSTGEFWNLTQTLTDQVNATLFWQNNDSSRINTYDNTLVVANYDGSSWSSQGQSAITAASAGNVTSNSVTVPTTGGQITFGSTNATSNPLLTPLIAAATINDFNCAGSNTGNVTANIMGGSGTYVYTWNTTPVQSSAIATGLSAGNYTVTVMDGNSCSATANITINAGLSASASVTAANSCYGLSNGSVTTNVSGGSLSYTYLWNTAPTQTGVTATGLQAGDYTVSITDGNACVATATVTLIDPAAVTANINTSSNPKCNGTSDGTAIVTAGGGTNAFSYTWNTNPVQTTASVTGLSANTYSVTVTDGNLCSATTTVVLTDPAVVTANVNTSTNPKCNGNSDGTAIVTTGGGTNSYSYSWNTNPIQTAASAAGLQAGTYSVTVTDGNLCTATTTVVLTDPAIVTANINTSTDPKCNGNSDGTAIVTAGGGTNTYSYSWNTNPIQTVASAAGLQAGTYSVTITDGNLCSATSSVTLTAPPVLTADSGTSTNATCIITGTASVVADGGTGLYTYLWSNNATNSSISNLASGTYNVTVMDANLCSATTKIILSNPGGVIANITPNANPTCNASSDGSATVVGSGGMGSYTYVWSTNATTSSISALPAGTYSVTVTDANQCVGTANIKLIAPSAIVANISTSANPTCNGTATGSATVNVGGGTPTYTYSWNTTPVQTGATATGLPEGNYTVTVTDANLCPSGTANITLIAPSVIVANVSASANPKCDGTATGSATVNVSGGTPAYTYSWNTTPVQTGATATGLLAGTYTVIVGDANLCPSGTATIIVKNPLVVSVVTDTVHKTSCYACADGGIGVVVSGGNKNIIVWQDSTAIGYKILSNHTSDTATDLVAGTYVCIATDSCQDFMTDTIRIAAPAPTSIQAINVTNKVVIYPSPNNGHFTVSLKGDGYEGLHIYDETGKELYTRQLTENIANDAVVVDMSIYANGVYFAQIATRQGTINKKIILQK